MISGYTHIINRARIRSSQDLAFMEPNQLSRQSQGQLKTTIRVESTQGRVNQSLALSVTGDHLMDGIRESFELSQVAVANPFKQQTFGTKTAAQLIEEEDKLRQSTKTIAYEAELEEKSSEELKAIHQANMDELDTINKRLLATLNRHESAEKNENAEEDDMEREAPLEEEKFQ